MAPLGHQPSCGPATLCPSPLLPPYPAALHPSQHIPPYPTAVCPSHLVLPKHSASPTGCVCCQRPSWMKCLIWWPLPLRFGHLFWVLVISRPWSSLLGLLSREVNMGCLLQYPPDRHHCPHVDMTRDVFMKQWQILTEIRPRSRFAFVDSSHTSVTPRASGSDNLRQQTGAASAGTGVRFHHAKCSLPPHFPSVQED